MDCRPSLRLVPTPFGSQVKPDAEREARVRRLRHLQNALDEISFEVSEGRMSPTVAADARAEVFQAWFKYAKQDLA